MRIFSNDSLFGRFFGQLGDIIILNILFILFSLPIITIGASYSAMYYAFLTRLHHNDTSVYRSFWKAFRENFKCSTLTWLLTLLLAFIAVIDLYTFSSRGMMPNTSLFYLFGILSAMIALWAIYVFPVIASFANTLKNLWIQSFFLAAKNILWSLLIACIIIIPVFFSVQSLQTLLSSVVVWIICGFALTAYINSFIFYRIFSPYLGAPGEAEKE